MNELMSSNGKPRKKPRTIESLTAIDITKSFII